MSTAFWITALVGTIAYVCVGLSGWLFPTDYAVLTFWYMVAMVLLGYMDRRNNG